MSRARGPRPVFAGGDYLLFTKANGKAVPVIVWVVERRRPLRYDFVFPSLGKATDPDAVRRILDTREPVTDDELAAVLSKGKRPRVFTLEDAAIRGHLHRLQRFGNRPFNFPAWQCGACGYGVTFADFERNANESGSRALAADELAVLAASLAPVENPDG